VLSDEMQNAIKRYQSTNGLRQTGDLDSDTLAVMGLCQERVPKIEQAASVANPPGRNFAKSCCDWGTSPSTSVKS